MIRHTSLWFLVVLATSFLLAPQTAAAQDDKAKAVQLIKEANAHTDAGEHRPALMKYKAAFDIMEDPRILYRIGLAYEELSNYQRAREHLELYLFADPKSEYKDRIEKKIALLKEKEKTLQARIQINSNPAGARVFVDGERNKPFGKTPLTLPVGPGEHSLIVAMGEAKKTISVKVGEGETVTETVELGPDALVEKTVTPNEGAEEVATGGGKLEPARPAGSVTRVDIAPPTFLLVIGWALITVSSAMFMVAGFGLSESPGIVYTIAAASLVGGGYILWFGPDAYTDQLDRVGVDDVSTSMSIGAGYEWTW